VQTATLERIRAALEAEGIEFTQKHLAGSAAAVTI
jgi:hypothetical protein